MKKIITKIVRLSFIFSFIFLFFILTTLKVSAADGCCELDEAGTKSFFNDSQENCESYNEYENYYAIWHENQVEAPDKKSCIDKKTDNLGTSLPKFSNPIDNPKLSVNIPGFTGFRSVSCETITNADGKIGQECSVPWLADYMIALYRYGIGIIVILAVIIMMIGGVIWITAGGNDKKISDAKNWIGGSLFGILIALSSYVILIIINPALVELSPIKISSISKEDLDITTMAETPTNDVMSGTIQSKGQECFLEKFGASNSAVTKELVPVKMFGKTVQVHKLAKDAFQKVSDAVTGKTNYKFYSLGTQNWRANVNNSSKLSLHSFGIAIDINPDENPNYRSKERPCKTDIPASVIQAFTDNGFRWGGNYKSVCDSMHFEWLGPCQK